MPDQILATGKRVVIIGGGDTGADCLGTSHRQKAAHISQFELLPKPPDERAPQTPWPLWPMQLRVESSHEEGGLRDWSVSTVRFTGDEHGNVKKLHGVRVGAPPKFEAISRLGVRDGCRSGAARHGLHRPGAQRACSRNSASRSTRAATSRPIENYMSSVPGVFAAGDMRRGQSLVVWAIAEGRKAARGIDEFLMGTFEAARLSSQALLFVVKPVLPLRERAEPSLRATMNTSIWSKCSLHQSQISRWFSTFVELVSGRRRKEYFSSVSDRR